MRPDKRIHLSFSSYKHLKLIFGQKRASDFAKLATNELDKVWYGDFTLKY